MDEAEARRALGRALARLRRDVTVPCAVCGLPMTGKVHRRTCSEACRSRAYRERKRQQQVQGHSEEEQGG